MGLPDNDRISPVNFINSRHILDDSTISGVAETQEMLNFCSKNLIKLEGEIT